MSTQQCKYFSYDYDIDVEIPTTVRLDNGTLDRIFQDIDIFLEKEFEGGIN